MIKQRTYAIGDIHGNYRGLMQALEACGIDKEKDELIVLGDVVDGYPDVIKVIDELLTFKNLIIIEGNHDAWAKEWLEYDEAREIWLRQGGANTYKDYQANKPKKAKHLKDYFRKAAAFYHDTERKHVYVHGGFNWHLTLEQNGIDVFLWDRHMVETAQYWQADYDKIRTAELQLFPGYDRIFVGHTDTRIKYDGRYEAGTNPAFLSNLINLDTGGGWQGKITIMDVDSKEYWQSDLADDIYPFGHLREPAGEMMKVTVKDNVAKDRWWRHYEGKEVICDHLNPALGYRVYTEMENEDQFYIPVSEVTDIKFIKGGSDGDD